MSDGDSSNEALGAALPPVLNALPEASLPSLRLLCKDVKSAVDANRRSLDVTLPRPPCCPGRNSGRKASGDGAATTADTVSALLTGLVALQHANLSAWGDGPPCNCNAAAHPDGSDPWAAALQSLRTRHLRVLRLEGLHLHLHRSAQHPHEATPPCCQHTSLGSGSGSSGGGSGYTTGTAHSPASSSCGGAGDGEEGGASQLPHGCAPPLAHLVARVLAGAPALQELAISAAATSTVTAKAAAATAAPVHLFRPEDPSPAEAACAAGSGDDAAHGALGAAPRPRPRPCGPWCPVLRALPSSLATLRLTHREPPAPPAGRPQACARPPARPAARPPPTAPASPVGSCAGSVGSSAGSATASSSASSVDSSPCPSPRGPGRSSSSSDGSYHHTRPHGDAQGVACGSAGSSDGGAVWSACPPHAACLAAALRRLPHLGCLELGGVPASAAVGAVRRLQLPTPPAPPAAADAAACALGPAAPPRCPPCAASPVAAAAPALGATALPPQRLTRLVLDVCGRVDLGELLVAVRALPLLRHLAVVEDAVGERGGGAAAGSLPQPAAAGYESLDAVLALLRVLGLQHLSLTLPRTFTTLAAPGNPAAGTCLPAPFGTCLPPPSRSSTEPGGGADGGSGGGEAQGMPQHVPWRDPAAGEPGAANRAAAAHPGGACSSSALLHARLSVSLTAEALLPLVVALPPSITCLHLCVPALHRPADALAGAAAASAAGAASAGRGSVATPPADPAAASTPGDHYTTSGLAASPTLPSCYSAAPDSFLCATQLLWPALTVLPAALPALAELRLGGAAAGACCDHVLRCWASASGHPHSLATPMVANPDYNAMLLVEGGPQGAGARLGAQQQRQGVQGLGGEGGLVLGASGGSSSSSGGGSGRCSVTAAAPAAAAPASSARGGGGRAAAAPSKDEPLAHGAHRQGWDPLNRQLHLRLPHPAPGAPAPGGGGTAGGGGGPQGAPRVAASDWATTLRRVCLTAPGPSPAGALHLRRFMPHLTRLQVVAGGGLTDVAVAGRAAGPQ